MKTPEPVNHVYQTAIVYGYIVCADSVATGLRFGFKMANFFGRMWIGDVDQTHTAREPSKRDNGARDDFARLMAAGKYAFWLADHIQTIDLPGRDGDRIGLVCDVEYPHERRRMRAQFGDIFVCNDHVTVTANIEG